MEAYPRASRRAAQSGGSPSRTAAAQMGASAPKTPSVPLWYEGASRRMASAAAMLAVPVRRMLALIMRTVPGWRAGGGAVGEGITPVRRKEGARWEGGRG